MPLKKSEGNMYPWVTHTHTHLAGACPHKCSYCYVQTIAKRFSNSRYNGDVRLVDAELKVKYGEDRTIFIENCNDLFAVNVPAETIMKILGHCQAYPKNTYVFQTKNPYRLLGYTQLLPRQSIIGTTIESNRWQPGVMGNAPAPANRKDAMIVLRHVAPHLKRFVTIEPILDFDVKALVTWISEINPNFVNIGADSKGTNLPEPSAENIRFLIVQLKAVGIEIREKHNLQRILA